MVEDALDDVRHQRGLGRVELRDLPRAVRRVAMHAVDAGIDEVHRRAAGVDQVLPGRAVVDRLLVPHEI